MLYISHLLEDEEMKQLILQTKMGVESIEFSISDNLDQLEKKIGEYEKRLIKMEAGTTNTVVGTNATEFRSKSGTLTLHGPFLDLNPAAFDSIVQQATMTRYEQCYQAARQLGAKKIIFHSCFVPSVYFLEGWAERMAEFLNRFLENKSEEIQILMENVLDPFPEPFAEVAGSVTHPAFGICLDVGHANCYSNIPCERWISELETYIRHVHLHDNCGDKDSHLGFGDGTLQKEKILSLIDRGIDGTIECRNTADVLQTYRICAGNKKRGKCPDSAEYETDNYGKKVLV